MINFAAIKQFQDEINELRKTIAYCEGRILRKEIAIAECLLSSEPEIPSPDNPPAEAAPAVEPATVAPPAPAPNLGLSVRALVEGILPQMGARIFWYSDLKTICVAGFPEHADKIRKGIYPAVHELVKARKIFRTVNGLTTTPPP